MAKNKKKKTEIKKEPKVEKSEEKITENSNGSMTMDGVVVEALRGKFRVEIQLQEDGPAHQVLAHLGGKMRTNWIKIVPGDKVKVEVSPYDLTRGRITYRMK